MNQGHVRRRCPKPIEGKCAARRCGHAWEWRFSHDGRVFTGSEPTERASRAAMVKAMAQAADGRLVTKREQRAAEKAAAVEAARTVRLGAYLDEWLAARGDQGQAGGIKPATRRGYADIIDNHIRPRLGDVPLVELRKIDVRRLLEDLARPDAKGRIRTVGTLSRIRSLLSGALEAAVVDELVDANVARGVKIPETAGKGRGRLRPEDVFSPAQLAAFLELADKTQLYGPVLRFIAATGVRRGEAVGLRWSDVDLDAGLVTIQRSLTKVRSEYVLDTTKTEDVRRIPLTDDIVVALREVKREQAAMALQLAHGRVYNPEGWVFTRADGSHLRPDSVTQTVENLATAMGLPHLHLHSLRHSMGAAAIDAGVDVKVVADLLGHKSTATTHAFYQRTSDAAARAGAEAIAAWRAGSVAKPVASGEGGP